MQTISPHSALIYVMVVVSAADGTMSEKELKTMGALIKTLPVFRNFEEHRLLTVAQECGSILQQEAEGLDTVLGLVREALPEQLRETAYWVALEVALTDSRIMLEEIRVLEILRRALKIDRLASAAMERAARARYQVVA